MKRYNKGFLQIGLAIAAVSLLVGVFLANQYKKSLDVSAVVAGACACKDANGNTAGGGECRGTLPNKYCVCSAPLSVKNDRCNEIPTGQTTNNPETIGCSANSVNQGGQTYFYCGGCVNTCVREDLLPNGCETYVGNHCGTGSIGSCSTLSGPV